MKNVSPSYLKHHFLIAMPHMADPNFAQTLTYIVEHTANGAMGLVVNRPQELNLADIPLAEQLSARFGLSRQPAAPLRSWRLSR